MSTLDPAAAPPQINGDGSWLFAGRIVRWIDGDTVVVDCLIDLGFSEMATRRRTIRLLGVNTAEKNDKDPAKRARAAAATEYVNELAPVGAVVDVFVVGYDKYGGRDDGRIALADVGFDVSTLLIDKGLGDPYFGGAR